MMLRRNQKGFTLIELLIVVAIIGIIAAIAIPNLLNAIDRGKQKRTMADMRSVGTAIESYSIDANYYPTAADVAALETVVVPLYIKVVPDTDGWGTAFDVDSTQTAYTLISFGKGGAQDDCTPGSTQQFTQDICFTGGQFVKYPEGAQQ